MVTRSRYVRERRGCPSRTMIDRLPAAITNCGDSHEETKIHEGHESLAGNGYDIRTAQELLGRRDRSTTMIELHVMRKGALGVKRPMDRL